MTGAFLLLLDNLVRIFGISRFDGYEIISALELGNIDLRTVVRMSAFEDSAGSQEIQLFRRTFAVAFLAVKAIRECGVYARADLP